MKTDELSAHPAWFAAAGVLALLGLSTAVVYNFRFTPYTMVLFMMGGQGLIVLAACCFGFAALWGIRARLRSIVELRYKAGDVVFRQGDAPDRLYVIGKGEVDVVREAPGNEDVVIRRLGKDQFFGEIGILSETPRTATIRAVTDLEVLSIHRSYFTSLFSYLPVFRDRSSRRTERGPTATAERLSAPGPLSAFALEGEDVIGLIEPLGLPRAEVAEPEDSGGHVLVTRHVRMRPVASSRTSRGGTRARPARRSTTGPWAARRPCCRGARGRSPAPSPSAAANPASVQTAWSAAMSWTTASSESAARQAATACVPE